MTYTAHALICAALQGEPPSWPQEDTGLGDEVLAAAARHGVESLLYAAVRKAGWPAPVVDALRRTALGRAAWEECHRETVVAAIDCLAAHGVRSLVLKGTALAYTDYPEPSQRTRSDTDLLIAPAHRLLADRVLRSAGFVTPAIAPGEFVASQATYARTGRDGMPHAIDLHWQPNNSPLLAATIRMDELLARARALPALGASAHAPEPIDALLYACLHRASHVHNPYYVNGQAHHEPDRLIWLRDLHLLARQFDASQWRELTRRACAQGLDGLTRDALRACVQAFGTSVPREILAPNEATCREQAAIYLHAGAIRRAWMDWRMLPDTRTRLGWIQDLFAPPSRYMRQKYGPGAGPLAWLYLRRTLSGLAGRLGGWGRTTAASELSEK